MTANGGAEVACTSSNDVTAPSARPWEGLRGSIGLGVTSDTREAGWSYQNLSWFRFGSPSSIAARAAAPIADGSASPPSASTVSAHGRWRRPPVPHENGQRSSCDVGDAWCG